MLKGEVVQNSMFTACLITTISVSLWNIALCPYMFNLDKSSLYKSTRSSIFRSPILTKNESFSNVDMPLRKRTGLLSRDERRVMSPKQSSSLSHPATPSNTCQHENQTWWCGRGCIFHLHHHFTSTPITFLEWFTFGKASNHKKPC